MQISLFRLSLLKIIVTGDIFSKNNVASIIKYESSVAQKRVLVLSSYVGHCPNNKDQNDCANTVQCYGNVTKCIEILPFLKLYLCSGTIFFPLYVIMGVFEAS